MFTMNSYSSGDCFVRKSRRAEEELVRCEMFHSHSVYLARDEGLFWCRYFDGFPHFVRMQWMCVDEGRMRCRCASYSTRCRSGR